MHTQNTCGGWNIAVVIPVSTLSFPMCVTWWEPHTHTEGGKKPWHKMRSCTATPFTPAVPPPAVLLPHLPGNYTIMDDYHFKPQLSGCRGLLSPWCHVSQEQQLVKWKMILLYCANLAFLFIPFSEINLWGSGCFPVFTDYTVQSSAQ